MKTSIACVLAAVASLMTLDAEAAIKLNATRTGSYTLLAKFGGWIPLDDLGNQSLKFNMPEAKKLVLSFSMECGVSGNLVGGTLPAYDLDIRLNNVAVTPTETIYGPIACSLGRPYDVFGTRTTVTLQINAKKGANTIDVYVRGLATNGLEYMASWATSLVVWD